MHIPEGTIDLVTLGEALIDMISVEEADSLFDVTHFEKHQGGSPANICVNLAKLGGRAAFVGKTGIGAFGNYIKAELNKAGVITNYMVMDHRVHTSIVFVTRTQDTPDFEALRDADFRLEPKELDEDAIRQAKVVHASIWPISREPFRTTVQRAFQIAQEMGKIISFDPNYSRQVWPNYREAFDIISDILSYTTITKPSLDDAQRLFEEDLTPEAYIQRFHDMGPDIVVFTMGKKGMLLSQKGQITHIPAQRIKVVDATGAGDSFWAGFLMALLDSKPLEHCVLFAREIVGMKLSRVGPLPRAIDRQDIYRRISI